MYFLRDSFLKTLPFPTSPISLSLPSFFIYDNSGNQPLCLLINIAPIVSSNTEMTPTTTLPIDVLSGDFEAIYCWISWAFSFFGNSLYFVFLVCWWGEGIRMNKGGTFGRFMQRRWCCFCLVWG